MIEAVQHFDDMGNHTAEIPVWLIEACGDGTVFAKATCIAGELAKVGTFVKTLGGDIQVYDGDWIIRGVKGELYPCKPDIFAATYEAV